MADKKKLSVSEILAAARRADGGGEASDAPPSEEEAASTSPAESAAAAEEPRVEAAAPKLEPGERPSVADILKMARSGAAGEPKQEAASASTSKGKVESKAKPKPAAKAAKPAKPAPAERKETASILAAARKADKHGPVSKAEAAKLQPEKGKREKPPARPVAVIPEKPAYAIPVEKTTTKTTPTVDKGRRYIALGVVFGSAMAAGFTLLTTTLGLWTLALARFMFPNIVPVPPTRFKVGYPDEFAFGQVQAKYKGQYGIWVVHYSYNGQSQIYALSTVCTHLGCTPNWLEAEQKFKCPCHGSGFYKDGINFEGPAPRPLERYAVAIADDGQLEVDKSKKFQEEMGQWEDSDSFVAV